MPCQRTLFVSCFPWSPLHSSLAVLIPLAVVLYVAWTAEKQRERVEQLAGRLRRLCESTGRPEIRTRRPRRLPMDVPLAILSVEKSLRALERGQGIRSRRPRHPLLFLEHKTLIENLEQRVSRLEESGLR